MKKALTIFILLVFAFNLGGYYLLFVGMRYHATQQLTARLDDDHYSSSETFLFKVRLTLPYQINQSGYERVDGKFERNGEHYRLVKQKLENDTLYIVCIKDPAAKRLEKAMGHLADLSNDMPASSRQGQTLLAKLAMDFEANDALQIVTTPGWCSAIATAFYLRSWVDHTTVIPSPPPDLLFHLS